MLSFLHLLLLLQLVRSHQLVAKSWEGRESNALSEYIPPVPQREIDALQSIYNALGGEGWSWNRPGLKWEFYDDPQPCNSWQGITCATVPENHTSYIMWIDLRSYALMGSLPDAIANLTDMTEFIVTDNSITGTISGSVFGSLQFLQKLWVGNNQLHGQFPISSFLNSRYLKAIDIMMNDFTGTISDDWSRLPYIQYIQLSSNHLSGSLPASLAASTTLRWFECDANNITGTIPHELGTMKKLAYLSAKQNHLNGTIPANLADADGGQMIYIDLSNNTLSGPIPETLGNLKDLYWLDLASNSLNGTLPASLSNCDLMINLVLSQNRLEGTIPPEYGALSQLTIFDVSENQLTGSLPNELGGMTGLSQLIVFDNRLGGSLPASMSACPSFNMIAASNNSLVGTLPPEWSNATLLQEVDVSFNLLEGSIPASWANLTWLDNLDLSNNRLTGTIPPELFTVDSNLVNTVRINSNRLRGSLPDTMGYLISAWFFNASANFLHGTIPEAIISMQNLQILCLNDNKLSGPLPEAIPALERLGNLFLQSNRLSGTLPRSISEMRSVESLFLSDNAFTGTTEGVFNASTQINLINVDLSQNQLSGPIPTEPFRVPSLETFAAVTNCFTGSIPEEICASPSLNTLSLDGLQSASSCQSRFFTRNVFDLDSYGINREITGGIPECLLRMTNLRVLHLSGNGITGSLPDVSLSSRLQDFSVSHNRLRGHIPMSYQQHNWSAVDYSYNKFDGHLSGDIPRIGGSQVALDVNRLSGRIPRPYKDAEHLTVLNGNLFSCDLLSPDLPSSDPYSSKYECGSNSFDISVNVWVVCFGCVVAVSALLVILFHNDTYAATKGFSRWVKMTRALRRGVIRWWRVYEIQQYSDIYRLGGLLKRIRHCALLVSAFIVVVLMPVYIVLSQYWNSYSDEYAYVASASYLTGRRAAIVLLVLFVLLGGVSCWLHWQYFGAHRVEATDRLEFDENTSRGRNVARTAATVGAVLFDMFAVLGVNIAYVFISNNYSPTIVRFTQVFVVLFKLTWNNVVVLWLMRCLRDQQSKDIRVATLMTLFNNLAAPFMATSLVSANCFKYVVSAPPEVSTTYYYCRCGEYWYDTENDVVNCRTDGYVNVTSTVTYDPPFLYSYQCSSTIVSTYASIYIIMFIISGFVSPVLQWLAHWVHVKSEGRVSPLVRTLLGLMVPVLWKTTEESSIGEGGVVPGTKTVDRESFEVNRGSRDSFGSNRGAAEERSTLVNWVKIVMIAVTKNVPFHYFDCDLFLLRIINMLSIIVTFGAVFPPIAAVGCITLLLFVCFTQLLIGRFVTHSDGRESESAKLSIASASGGGGGHAAENLSGGQRQLASEEGLRLSRINEDCVHCDLMLMDSLWIVAPFAVVFYSLFLFDTLGDAVGWKRALIPPLILVVAPVLVWLAVQAERRCCVSRTRSAADGDLYDLVNVLHLEEERDSKFSHLMSDT